MQITIDGKVYDLVPREETTPKPKKTGYERVEEGDKYFYENAHYKDVVQIIDIRGACNNTTFENADYYTDEKLAEDNIRADRLLRRLRRFSAVNRKNKIDWEDNKQSKFTITFSCNGEGPQAAERHIFRSFGEIYFDTKELATKAIEIYRDDLMWYFTEYKDIAEESAEDDD